MSMDFQSSSAAGLVLSNRSLGHCSEGTDLLLVRQQLILEEETGYTKKQAPPTPQFPCPHGNLTVCACFCPDASTLRSSPSRLQHCVRYIIPSSLNIIQPHIFYYRPRKQTNTHGKTNPSVYMYFLVNHLQ